MIYENSLIRVEIEPFEIHWLKVFTVAPMKDFSLCSQELKLEILRVLYIIEKEMLYYFECDKINIASFGNYVPHVHFHIQARFKDDSYFPEPTWGTKQRESILALKDMSIFYTNIQSKLNKER